MPLESECKLKSVGLRFLGIDCLPYNSVLYRASTLHGGKSFSCTFSLRRTDNGVPRPRTSGLTYPPQIKNAP